MDAALSNVLEGARQYFMGLPKQAQSEGSGQPVWPAGAAPPEEGTPAQSGAPASHSRPPSAAAAPPATPIQPPPRPPSEPIEPEPHIIHKATVMREALEKRREQPEPEEDYEESNVTLSPPSHIIRKPSAPVQSPALAPAAPCPSPARPPSIVPEPVTPDHAPVVHVASQAAQTYNSRQIDTYKTPRSQETFGSARLSEPYNTGRTPEPYNVHRPPDPYAANRPPDPYATRRPPDPYTASRPPEPYQRYHHYETPPFDGGRTLRGPPSATMPPSARYSPQQTYARISSTMPVHARIRDHSANSPPARIPAAVIPSMTPNDRVPPIHHPISSSSGLNRPTLPYSSTHPSRESSSYARPAVQYDRHTAPAPRKYDPQQSYSGYRPTSSYPPGPRVDPQQMHYKHTTMDNLNPHSSYAARGTSLPYDTSKLPSRSDYSNPIRALDSRNPLDSRGTVDARGSIDSRGSVDSRSSADSRGLVETSTRNVLDTKSLADQRNIVDTRTNHNYVNPSSSNNRYLPNATVPIHQNAALPAKTAYPPPAASKATYDYPMTNNMQTSPARPTAKPGIVNQQARMTVSVTALVNQMNQTKQKRESPLDLSVKTVKNSADSSTAQEELVDSLEADIKILLQQSRPSSTTRQSIPPVPGLAGGQVSSHKVDFAPDFQFQYRERLNNQNPVAPSNHTSTRYNGALHAEPPRQIPVEQDPVPSRPNVYYDRNRFNSATSAASKPEYYPRIDLTTTVAEELHSQIKVRDDRGYAHIERKRSAGAIVSNIPEKMMRYGETWSADSKLERVNRIDRSAKEQQELMSQPVYSYSSHKRFEAYQNEQKKQALTTPYRSPQVQNESRYAYAPEAPRIPTDYNQHFNRVIPSSGRPVVQKITNHRDVHHHHYHHHHHLEHNNGVPADKRVLSILRNSLEIKQVGLVEPPKQAKEIPDLIVIDDIDDTVIEITDLSKENYGNRLKVISDTKTKRGNSPAAIASPTIKIPRAVDSIASDFESKNLVSIEKSPEIDVASRIRTKAELKVMPPSEEHTICAEAKESTVNDVDKRKQVPKSQKQHLFNQIREDNLRKESTVKTEETTCLLMTDIKSEPMNIEEIEKDAITPLKTDSFLTPTSTDLLDLSEDDFDWASACDNFVEQLKTGCHKKKSRKRRNDAEVEIKTEPVVAENYLLDNTRDLAEENLTESNLLPALELESKVESIKPYDVEEISPPFVENIVIKQEPRDEEEIVKLDVPAATQATLEQVSETSKLEKDELVTIEKRKNFKIQNKNKMNKIIGKRKHKEIEKISKIKKNTNKDNKKEKRDTTLGEVKVKQEITKIDSVIIKEEYESTDDDEPLIKSKILKEKEKSDRMKFQLLKDLSEKSAYVKLECCEKVNRQSLDSLSTAKEKQQKHKFTRQTSRHKAKSLSSDNLNKENKRKPKNTSSDSESDDISVACRLRLRKTIKQEDEKLPESKTAIKPSPIKTQDINSNSSTTICKPGFGDGSGFHPGWEEELYKYKRSLRMPSKLIAIPRGRSGGPYPKSSAGLFNRGSTSLPDLDPAPLSPAPSSVRSAATDDLYTRRQDKVAVDSDLDSNSSYSAPPKLHYDSEASTSTVLSTTNKKKGSSIVDVLMQKCGKHEDSRRKGKDKIKDETTPKIITKKMDSSELSPMPISGLVKSSLSEEKKDKAVDNSCHLYNIKKKTGSSIGDKTIGVLGVTEVIPKSRTRTESRVIKNRASIKEVFGDDRPASAPPSACRKDEDKDLANVTNCIKKESDDKPKSKHKKQPREKLKKRSNSIREGLRSTMSLKRNDAKGRLLRLKKRNNLLKSLTDKKIKAFTFNKSKKSKSPSPDQKLSEIKAEKSDQLPDGQGKKKFKRLFGRRKFSSGFDYIRKKKKIIRTDGQVIKKVRRPVSKPNPESIHDIQKEIKSWFINKSIGETHLHRAARLGYSDCVAYCLEKMEHDPSAKDNAGFTALHVAAAKGYVFIGRLLLEYGANVSAAAQGGIRPLHEAAENNHIEMIRLLLSYGADPILGTYAGQTPVELAEGKAAILLRLHIADVQGYSLEPWHFPLINKCLDESGCNPLSSPPPATPPPPPDSTIEIQCTDAPLPPFYSLRAAPGQPADGLWCLMQDLTSLLQIKSKDSLLKQIHCGSGSPKELFREIKTPEFLERAQCHQLLCAGEKVNVRASKVALVRVTDKLRQLLKVETVLVS